jgi:hypothetical protein
MSDPGVSARLDPVQQAINVRFDLMRQEINWHLSFMRRIFTGVILLTFIVLGYLLHTSTQTSVGLARVDGRVDAVDGRLVIVDQRIDAVNGRLDAKQQ